MSNTEHAGVSHQDIFTAIARVRGAVPAYNWKCVPGQWLSYTLLLALPFSAKVVRPDTVSPIWFCKPKRNVRGIQRRGVMGGSKKGSSPTPRQSRFAAHPLTPRVQGIVTPTRSRPAAQPVSAAASGTASARLPLAVPEAL